ncbi:hypothetical protein DVH24_013875 [Malus domestica]|uniref:Uncharacterized protein n=1 Tax=Malus domestica TaxID=3750 RepID=A0A498JBX5_MALDO|nr:hypothetical protein DVH24_013875 [Malus domestica]
MMNLRVKCALVSASFSLRVHHHVSSKYPPKGTSFGLKDLIIWLSATGSYACYLQAGQTIQVGDLMKLSSKQFISTIWDSLNVPFTYGEGSKILIRLGGNMVVLGCSLEIYASARKI